MHITGNRGSHTWGGTLSSWNSTRQQVKKITPTISPLLARRRFFDRNLKWEIHGNSENGKTPRERKLHQSQKYMFWNTFNMCYCANPIVNASFMGVMEMYAVNIFPFLSFSSPFFPFLSFPFLSFCFLSCPFLFFLCFSLLVLPFISLSFFISYLLFDIDVSANVSLWLLPHAPTHVNASWSDFT